MIILSIIFPGHILSQLGSNKRYALFYHFLFKISLPQDLVKRETDHEFAIDLPPLKNICIVVVICAGFRKKRGEKGRERNTPQNTKHKYQRSATSLHP